MNRTNKVVKMSFLLAIAMVLSYFESLFPLTLPLPGVKIGLANSIGLIVLYIGSKKDYLFFMFIKLILISLLRSGFGTSFLIGLSGTLFSSFLTILVFRFTRASIYGLSIVGATSHSLGQILMVIILYNNIYMINYLPILIISSIISGLITAMLAAFVLKRMPKSLI